MCKGRSIFLLFCNKLDFQKAQSVPLLQFKKTLRFLSHRYSADLRRSRLAFLFFRQTSTLVPLFSTDFNRFKGNPAVAGSSPCFSQALLLAFAKPDEFEKSRLSIFLQHCVTFFQNFFAFKESPSKFCYFATNWGLKKPKGLLFYIFWHYENVSNF